MTTAQWIAGRDEKNEQKGGRAGSEMGFSTTSLCE